MKRSVRKCLGDLLLGAFDDPEKRTAITWLKLFCDLAAQRDSPEVHLISILSCGRAVLPELPAKAETALAHLIGPEKLLRLYRADTGEDCCGGMPPTIEEGAWLLTLEPDTRAAFVEIHELARIYAALLKSIGQGDAVSVPRHPLRRAMAQTALCFNAGLFFEAHEHLERHWAVQPRGPTKRFLQGIIQISVGFHHARLGNYGGAVNQLAKGLEKTAGVMGEMLGLDCDEFLPRVAASRESIVAHGRTRMRSMPLEEVPRMSVRW